MDEKELIYLAMPYRHKDALVRLQRIEDGAMAMAALIKHTGGFVFSPIEHSSRMAEVFGIRDQDYWLEFDGMFFPLCDELWVLQLDGWDKSDGVRLELHMAEVYEKPIHYFTMKEVEEWLGNSPLPS